MEEIKQGRVERLLVSNKKLTLTLEGKNFEIPFDVLRPPYNPSMLNDGKDVFYVVDADGNLETIAPILYRKI